MASTGGTRWYERDTTPGYLLLAATFISFLLINGPTGYAFHHLLEDPFMRLPILGPLEEVNLHLLINDALMVIFFLYVGLELKRETVEGPFKNPKEAALPMVGAIGGMAAPALIYLAIAGGADPAYVRGWAIPAATDIAFALGVLALLGSRVPSGLRLFLLALAIIDDLGAILVIALFYTTELVGWALGGAVVTFGAMLLMNRAGVKTLWPFWALGAVLWAFMLISGVHATIAGVLTALTVPMRRADGSSPLIEAEHALKNWVQLAIMPIFAVTNAGASLAGVSLSSFLHPVTMGVGLGLLIGKPVGITLSTFAAAAALKRDPPCGVTRMIGLSLIAGIGFTMSLFVGTLAFGQGDLAAPVRFGVLGGSLIAALSGMLVLALALRAVRFRDPALGAEESIAEARGVFEDHDAPPRKPKD